MENNNRRNFLKTGALAGAALLSTSTFSSVAGDNDIAGKSNRYRGQVKQQCAPKF